MTPDRYATPDKGSFESLFYNYYSGLVVYAEGFVGRTDVAEDIVHDLFLNIWEKQWRPAGATAKTYLFNSVHNMCLNYLSHLKVRSRYQEAALRNGTAESALPADYYVESELRRHIQRALDTLTPKQREVFLLSRRDGKTFDQIATELDISPRTVDKHMEMALRKLRHELADYLPLLILMGLL